MSGTAASEPIEYRLRWTDNLRPTLLYFGAITVLVVAYTLVAHPTEWLPALLVFALSVLVSALVAARGRAFYVRLDTDGLRAPHHQNIAWDSVTEAAEAPRKATRRGRPLVIRYEAAKGVERSLMVPPELDGFERFRDEVRTHLEQVAQADCTDPIDGPAQKTPS